MKKNPVYKRISDKVVQVTGPSDAFSGVDEFTLYMDGVDYQHELGNCEATVYDSVERLKKDRKKTQCWRSCGIVKLEVQVKKVKWVVKQDIFKDKDSIDMSKIPQNLKDRESFYIRMKRYADEQIDKISAEMRKLGGRRKNNDSGNRRLVQTARRRKSKK